MKENATAKALRTLGVYHRRGNTGCVLRWFGVSRRQHLTERQNGQHI